MAARRADGGREKGSNRFLSPSQKSKISDSPLVRGGLWGAGEGLGGVSPHPSALWAATFPFPGKALGCERVAREEKYKSMGKVGCLGVFWGK